MRRTLLGVGLLGKTVAVGVLAAASTVFSQAPTESASWRPEIPLGLDLYMPVPDENPLTPDKVTLGRRLFSDRLLSRDHALACATCHDPRRAFADGRPMAIGARSRTGTRSTPAIINRGYGTAQFWDGRARTLEDQVLEPIVNPKELDLTIDEAVDRLERSRQYRNQFRTVFGRAVNAEDLARALASYVRTILSGSSAFDRYMAGNRDALSDQARQGLGLFRGKGNCLVCHIGPTLTDEQFHNTGVAWRDGQLTDEGRFAISGHERDRGAFKTPTLREIARTAPYMHDGSLATLEAVVDFYDDGGRLNLNIDPEIHPLHLAAEEKQALVLFLQSLSGTIREGVQ